MEKFLVVDKEVGLLKFFKESEVSYSWNFENLKTLLMCRKRLETTCSQTNLSDLPPEVFFKEIFEKYLVKKITVKLITSVTLQKSRKHHEDDVVFTSDYHKDNFPIYTFCLSEAQFTSIRLIDILRVFSSHLDVPPTWFKVLFSHTEDGGKTFHDPLYIHPNFNEMYKCKRKLISIFSKLKKDRMFLQIVPVQSFTLNIPFTLHNVNYDLSE